MYVHYSHTERPVTNFLDSLYFKFFKNEVHSGLYYPGSIRYGRKHSPRGRQEDLQERSESCVRQERERRPRVTRKHCNRCFGRQLLRWWCLLLWGQRCRGRSPNYDFEHTFADNVNRAVWSTWMWMPSAVSTTFSKASQLEMFQFLLQDSNMSWSPICFLNLVYGPRVRQFEDWLNVFLIRIAQPKVRPW